MNSYLKLITVARELSQDIYCGDCNLAQAKEFGCTGGCGVLRQQIFEAMRAANTDAFDRGFKAAGGSVSSKPVFKKPKSGEYAK